LKMKEDEDIATYFLWVDEVVNGIEGLADEIKEHVDVQKLLISTNEIWLKDFISRRKGGSRYIDHGRVIWDTHSLCGEDISI
jgi:hypothetical protein